MTDVQFHDLIEMLSGLKYAIKFVGWMVLINTFFGGPGTSDIERELKRIAEKLKG